MRLPRIFQTFVLCLLPTLGAAAAMAQDASPLPPHVVQTSAGKIAPASGYAWINDGAGDFRVRWVPGLRHRDKSGVIAGSAEGNWTLASGYAWVDANATNDLRARWVAGQAHPTRRGLVSAVEEGVWCPGSGYRWANATPGDFTVVPIATGPSEEAVGRAIVKILGAAVAHAASQPGENDNLGTSILREFVKTGRDELIEGAVRDLFTDLRPAEVAAVRRWICLDLDGRLDRKNWQSATARDDLVADLRRDNVDAANAFQVAEFLAKVHQSRVARNR
jgi:hypothetical protein